MADTKALLEDTDQKAQYDENAKALLTQKPGLWKNKESIFHLDCHECGEKHDEPYPFAQ